MLGAFCLLRVPSGGLEPEQAPRRAKPVGPHSATGNKEFFWLGLMHVLLVLLLVLVVHVVGIYGRAHAPRPPHMQSALHESWLR